MTTGFIWMLTMAVTGLGALFAGTLCGWLFGDFIDRWFDRKFGKK